MFHLIDLIAKLLPPPLHRLGLRLAHAIRLVWWHTRRPLVVGCRVLAVNAQGEVLLVRHSYGSGEWMLPGGGVTRGEEPIAAAIRELAEETACTLTDPVEVAVTHRRWQGTSSIQHVIVGTIRDIPRSDGREIIAAQCFAPDALPPDCSPKLAEKLAKWLAPLASYHQLE